jgi:serine protease Do
VVEIRVTQVFTGNEESQGEDMLPPEFRRFIPRGPHEMQGLGSGLVVDAEKGYVLTNYHVVEDANEVKVILPDHRDLKAEWIRSDPKTDLAIIKIKADGLIAAQLGDSDEMEVGDWVLAIGSPAGLEHTVTAGIISGKGRHTTRGNDKDQYEDFLQTDAAINRGNSGGPLVNMRAKVIGINTAIVTPGGIGQNAGIGLAIPSNLIKSVMTQLIEKGKVTRGYLGIQFDDAPGVGLRVRGVLDGSPAAQGGLRAGDVILSIDGQKLKESEGLRFLVAEMAPLSKHTFVLKRRGKEVELPVTIGEQPENMGKTFGLQGRSSSTETRGAEGIGLKVNEMTPSLAQRFGYNRSAAGVVITEVSSASALQAGLQPGLKIIEVDEQSIHSVQDFNEAMHKADTKQGVAIHVEGPDGAGKTLLLIDAENKDKGSDKE